MALGDDKEEEIVFAVAVDVDGLRRTLDNFMKQQEESNHNFHAGIEKILSLFGNYFTHPHTLFPKDKGSNVKGKHVPSPSLHIPSNQFSHDHIN